MNPLDHVRRRAAGRLAVLPLVGVLCLGASAACSAPGSTSTDLAGAGAETSAPETPETSAASTPGEPAPGAPAAAAPGPAGPTRPSTAATGPTGSPTSPGPAEAATADVVGARTLAPVPVRTPARFSEGLTVTVTSVREAQVTAVFPGEVSGPGMVVQLTFANRSPDPVDLDGVRVSATLSDGSPATAMEGPPYSAPTGVLAPGDSAQATVVYAVPQGTARSTTLEITSVSSTDTVTVDV